MRHGPPLLELYALHATRHALRGSCAVGAVQVGRAGRFGTKGLAITFVASEQDSAVLNQVRPALTSRLPLLGSVLCGFDPNECQG